MHRRRLALGAGGMIILVVAGLYSLALGHASLGTADVWHSAWAHLSGAPSPLTDVQEAIIWQGRAPRVVAALAVGAGLALAGCAMQAVTHNPLADPYLLGISSGAGVGAVAVLVIGGTTLVWLGPAAFLGAILALGLTLALAGRGAPPVRTILAGVAVGYTASAVLSLLIFSSSETSAYREILSWLMGSLASATWTEALVALGGAVLGLGAALTRVRLFDSLLLGDRTAHSLGADVRRWRPWIMTGAAALTGVLVATSGAIGFVGLVIPHATRFLVGPRHRALLPGAALGGALFLLLADTVARTVFNPLEIPVGIVTALVGGPAFALLVRRARR